MVETAHTAATDAANGRANMNNKPISQGIFSSDYKRSLNGILVHLAYASAARCGYEDCRKPIKAYETYAWLRDWSLNIITYLHVDCAYKVADLLTRESN